MLSLNMSKRFNRILIEKEIPKFPAVHLTFKNAGRRLYSERNYRNNFLSFFSKLFVILK